MVVITIITSETTPHGLYEPCEFPNPGPDPHTVDDNDNDGDDEEKDETEDEEMEDIRADDDDKECLEGNRREPVTFLLFVRAAVEEVGLEENKILLAAELAPEPANNDELPPEPPCLFRTLCRAEDCIENKSSLAEPIDEQLSKGSN